MILMKFALQILVEDLLHSPKNFGLPDVTSSYGDGSTAGALFHHVRYTTNTLVGQSCHNPKVRKVPSV